MLRSCGRCAVRARCAAISRERVRQARRRSRMTPTCRAHQPGAARCSRAVRQRCGAVPAPRCGRRDAALRRGERRRCPRRRAPHTPTASSSEFEARRLAPCTPVEATSPAAHKPGERGAAVGVGRDAAHVVVRGRRDRDQLARRIDAGARAVCGHGGKSLGECRADRRAGIEERAAPGLRSRRTRARATISRGASSASGWIAQHEALAALVDQHRAFAAQRFGRERRRIAADVDGGRMELDEFRIGDDRAGARRDRKAMPARLARIGGDRVKSPDAAGREHDRARRQCLGSRPSAYRAHACR